MRSFLRKNQKFLIASFLKGLVVDIDCSVRKESLFENSWKSDHELMIISVCLFVCLFVYFR